MANVWTRDALKKYGFSDSDITYDPSKGISVKGTNILGPGDFILDNGKSFADSQTIYNALAKNNMLPNNIVPVRDYLNKQGYDNSKIEYTGFGANEGMISYDKSPLLQNGKFNIIGDIAYANKSDIDNALRTSGNVSNKLIQSSAQSSRDDILNRLINDKYDPYSDARYLEAKKVSDQSKALAQAKEEERLAGMGTSISTMMAERNQQINNEYDNQLNAQLIPQLIRDNYNKNIDLYNIYNSQEQNAYARQISEVAQRIENRYNAQRTAIAKWEAIGYADKEVADILGIQEGQKYESEQAKQAIALANIELQKNREYVNGMIQQAKYGYEGQKAYSDAIKEQARYGYEGQVTYSDAIKDQSAKGLEAEKIREKTGGTKGFDYNDPTTVQNQALKELKDEVQDFSKLPTEQRKRLIEEKKREILQRYRQYWPQNITMPEDYEMTDEEIINATW